MFTAKVRVIQDKSDLGKQKVRQRKKSGFRTKKKVFCQRKSNKSRFRMKKSCFLPEQIKCLLLKQIKIKKKGKKS